MTQLTRRRFAALAAGALVARGGPARAQAFAPVLQRARGLDQLHAIVVAVDGRTVLAEAVRGAPLDRPVNVKSVSKTLVATLAGVAIDRGVLPGVDAPVAPYLRARVPRGADPRVEAITVEDLLTMRSGLERSSGPGYGAWVQSPDWVGYLLSRPMAAEPGDPFAYSTGDFHLLAVVLAEASGTTLLELARSWIGRPLGVEIPPWTRDPQGYYMGGNNMALSPRAMLAFGEAIRTGGAPIVPGDWIETVVAPAHPLAVLRPRTLRLVPRAPRRRDLAYARGYGGQMIYVVPGVGLTVAITSDPDRPARSEGHTGDLHALVAEDLIPAARAA